MMKKALLFLFASAMLIAQEKTVNLSMGSGYANEIYFKFSDESTMSFAKNIWDIAFLRTSAYNQGIRVNEGKGLVVYEASNDLNDWNNIDINAVTNTDALHNSDENWELGAFNFGSATYGWGEYDFSSHHVKGSVIFLIEESTTNQYYKFLIEDYYYGYHIKYAMWDGTAWGADQTYFIDNSINTDKRFNYFNLSTGQDVEASAPMTDWDIVFKKYSTLVPTLAGDLWPYTVTGILQNAGVAVAAVDEPTNSSWADISTLTFNNDINTIGYNWKELNNSWSYDIVPNKVFYIKANGIIYRMYMNSFAGSSTGDLSFTYEKEQLSTVDEAGEVQFAVYPNPVRNNQISLVYDNATNLAHEAKVEIYNMTGQKVFSTTLNQNGGLFQRNISLNNLPQGIYILKFIVGTDVKTEKIIIK